MPGMSGLEFLKQAKTLYPNTIRMILSGYSEVNTITSAINDGEVYRFLSKPWKDEDLISTVAHALEQYDLMIQNQQLSEHVQQQNRKLKSMNEDLENSVNERTHMLEMSRRILFNLPLPVVCADAEGMIVYVNNAAWEMFGRNGGSGLGMSVNDAFSKEVGDMIIPSLESSDTQHLEHCLWGEREFSISCAAIDPNDCGAGVTLILEKKKSNACG